MSEVQERIKAAVVGAHSIAFDGCHKIYVLMDAGQTDEMLGFGYDPLYVDDIDAAKQVLTWWESSCGLRFISTVSTTDGFGQVIEQGWDDPDDEMENEQ